MMTTTTGRRRAWAWLGACLGAALAVGLLLLVFLADLAAADQAASVAGVFVGLAGLAVSVRALWRDSAVPEPGGDPPPAHRPRTEPGRTVTASGPGAVAIGGDSRGDVSTRSGHTAAPGDVRRLGDGRRGGNGDEGRPRHDRQDGDM